MKSKWFTGLERPSFFTWGWEFVSFNKECVGYNGRRASDAQGQGKLYSILSAYHRIKSYSTQALSISITKFSQVKVYRTLN